MTTRRRATAKDGATAIAMLDSEKRAAARPFTAVDLRKCIGSAKFGIEAHDAPPADFPVQPSQKDGLGRMCQTHWKEYVRGLTRDANARRGKAPISPGWVATIAKADKRAAARKTEGEQIVDAVDDAIARLVASAAAAKLPETIADVASDEGQAALAAAAKAAQTARRGGRKTERKDG